MGKGVIADLMPLAVDALGDVAEFIRLDTDQEKSCRSVFALEHVQNFGSPLRIRSIVEGDGDLPGTSSIACYAIRRRQGRKSFVRDEAGR